MKEKLVTRTMELAEFERNCLFVIDKVEANGRPFVVTKDGVPIARLEPVNFKPKQIGRSTRRKNENLR